MTIRVFEVGKITDGLIAIRSTSKLKISDIAALLTNMAPHHDHDPSHVWRFELEIKQGPTVRTIMLNLPPMIPKGTALNQPVILSLAATSGAAKLATPSTRLVYFQDRVFASERPPDNDAELEEILLRVKKAVYEERASLAALRATVANYEAVIEFENGGYRREPISEDVKMVVWARDGGACGRCGSRNNLHFDHIIPVSKGGGKTEANIQLLCQPCNLKKSNNIAF